MSLIFKNPTEMIQHTEDIKKVIDMGKSLPPDKIVGGLKSVTVMEDKENEFESLFRKLAAKVRDHDKKCYYYDLCKSEQPRTYLFMEQYENKNALQQHQKSDHGKYYFPKIRELLEKIDVSYFECAIRLKSIIFLSLMIGYVIYYYQSSPYPRYKAISRSLS